MADRVIRQGLQPVSHSAVLAALAKLGQGQLHQFCGLRRVSGGDGVRDGIGQHAGLGVPARGRPVQVASPVGVVGGEPRAQRVGEQVVVAVPPPMVVKRDDEQVLALQGLEHPLTVGPAGQVIAETSGQLVEHGGVEEECAHVVRLPVQDLLDEVVKDEPVAPGEGVDETADVAWCVGVAGVGAGRQCSELQPGSPALSARLEGGHVRGIQPEPHDVVEEGVSLLGGEPEVCCAELEKVSTGTQPRQR